MKSHVCTLLLLLTAAPVWAADKPQQLNAQAHVANMTVSPAIAQAVAGYWRDQQNTLRDRYRHPAQTLAFFQLRPDAQVIEITPGNGWYSEILAPLLKQQGHYTAATPQGTTAEKQASNSKLRDKFNADSQHYGAANIVEFDANAPVFGPPDSADIVLTFRNMHNWVKAGNAAAYFRALHAVLKPGGILGVEDHRAAAGTALDINSGYLPEDEVIKLATAAGFRLDAGSEINANPRDSKDYPKGVWTLPPVLVLGDQDREKYLAIGESDRFTLRFVRDDQPASQPVTTTTKKDSYKEVIIPQDDH